MKKSTLKTFLPALASSLGFMLLHLAVQAQQQVEIEGQDVGNFFERNWMWITGAVVLLIIVLLFSKSGSNRRTTTTIVKDDLGNVKSVKTTDIRE